MNLSYQTVGSSKWNDVSVEFDPPLSGYEEVKPRLMQMKVDAEEGLGMVCYTFIVIQSLFLFFDRPRLLA
jgi:Protein of unknown function (DUF2470)